MTSEGREAAHGDRPARRRGRARREPRLSWWQESLLLLVLAVGLAVLIKSFVLQAFYIPSESMEPGLVQNDRILVQKISYWGGGEPERGDVVVFEDPGGWLGPDATEEGQGPLTQVLTGLGLYPAGGHLVKRVVGVEGDTIECCDEQGRLLVNGQPVTEDAYVADGARCSGPMTGDCEWSAGPVPPGHLFVMGDNRGMSADSSVHLCSPGQDGCDPDEAWVPVDHVVGRVFALVWPLDRLDWIAPPENFSEVPGGEDAAAG